MVNCHDCKHSFYGGLVPYATCCKQGHHRIYNSVSNCPLFEPTLFCKIFGETTKYNSSLVGGCVKPKCKHTSKGQN